MKPFLSIDQQIKLLKDRGLLIKDIEHAKKYLLTQNYYNIINGYGKFFPRNKEQYTNGSTFDEITHLFVFEREIKHAFFEAIIAMETHLKAILSHRFSQLYSTIPYAYLDINCYDKTRSLESIKSISRISHVISKYKTKPNNSIAHYINTYNDVPIWVLINFLDFGCLKHILINSTKKLKNIISKDLFTFIEEHISTTAPFPPEVMISFVENINDIRNICAHTNRLLDSKCKRDSKYWAPLHKTFNIKHNQLRNSPYSVMISLHCFLSHHEYATLQNTIRKQFNILEKRLTSISINDISKRLGFPNDWHHNTPKITTK